MSGNAHDWTVKEQRFSIFGDMKILSDGFYVVFCTDRALLCSRMLNPRPNSIADLEEIFNITP